MASCNLGSFCRSATSSRMNHTRRSFLSSSSAPSSCVRITNKSNHRLTSGIRRSRVMLVLGKNSHLVRAFDHSTVFQHPLDRKSTRLNSSHSQISYAVFCLKKQNDPINL